jgi:hypothetical protein
MTTTPATIASAIRVSRSAPRPGAPHQLATMDDMGAIAANATTPYIGLTTAPITSSAENIVNIGPAG